MTYWDRTLVSRRQLLRGMGAAGGGLAVLSFVGCGGNNSGGGSGEGGGVGASRGVGSAQGYAIPGTGLKPLDAKTLGKRGGTFIAQGLRADTTRLITSTGNYAGRLTHSSLIQYTMGYQGGAENVLDGSKKEPDLAVSLPETPDQTTYIFKLRQDVKFHNGDALTAEDITYTFDRMMNVQGSRERGNYAAWLDKVEATDKYTVKMTTKFPFVDSLNTIAWFFQAVNKKWEESPAADTQLMGTGPFKFKSHEPPVIIRLERNPDYFDKPFPFFDEMHVLGAADDSKKLADWASKQVHSTYWVGEELRDQMARARPDGICFCIFYPTPSMFMRVDKPPFNDKRVRQALMLSVDRNKFRAVATKGEGEDDQYFGWPMGVGFRKPAELGANSKYWKYDPTAAKQLLSAAGIPKVEAEMYHYDATVVGQAHTDAAVFLQQHWREQGFADFTDRVTTNAQASTGWLAGNYEGAGFWLGDAGGFIYPYPWSTLQRNFDWPIANPSANRSHIDDPGMRDTIAKVIRTFDANEQKSLLTKLEDTMADEHYVLSFSTRSDNFFIDPRLKNAQIPLINLSGSLPWAKKYWFDS